MARRYGGYLALLTDDEAESYAFADHQRRHGQTKCERQAGSQHCQGLAAQSRKRIQDNLAKLAAGPTERTIQAINQFDTQFDMEVYYGATESWPTG